MQDIKRVGYGSGPLGSYGFGAYGSSASADIRADSTTITPDSPCILGTCSIEISVTWKNHGDANGTDVLTIKIDDNPITPAPDPQTLSPLETVIKTFTVTGLATGQHMICPSPI